MSASMFEAAVRNKVRFDSPKGLLTVEDLYDLPLTSAKGANLDDIALALDSKLSTTKIASFVAPVKRAADDTQLKFEIVKHVIATKIAERDAAAERVQRAEKKQAILAAIAQKETEQLTSSSIEDLRKMAENL